MMIEAIPRDAIREVDASPNPASLIEGHRDFGYTLETALADIIDNSISAGARKVEIRANTVDESPWIAITDNGCGMTETELVEAMRLGSKNPNDRRSASDLGRFGLGLKSASFSQCRCLTVCTRKNSKTSIARWDLDHVALRNDWNLEILAGTGELARNDLLSETGTVVIWEKLDRLTGGYTTNHGKRTGHMNSELSRAERHLRLVFHKYLEGHDPRLTLSMNERILVPIDPMASSHTATQNDPEEVLKLDQGVVRVQCHTLPHHKKMAVDEWNELAGTKGHLRSQGLYVYREDRLIIAGGWLGLTRQTELTKLCRIAVYIPNTMDSEWKIDVRKASAQLPPFVRERLKKIINRFIGTSKRTYKKRGRKLVDKIHYPIWLRVKHNDRIMFRINLDHPIFQSHGRQLSEELRMGFERCLRLVGSALPIETLHAEFVGNAEAIEADAVDDGDLTNLVHELAKTLYECNIPAADISNILRSYPFFQSNWDYVELLLEDYLSGISE